MRLATTAILVSSVTAASVPASPHASDTLAVTATETFVAAPNGSRLYVRVVQPDPVAYPGRRFPAVVTVPGGTGAGAPLADRPSWRRLASSGFVVVAFNAEGRGSGAPGNLRSDGVEDCNGAVHQDDLAAVVAATAALPSVDAANLGVATSSFGIAIGAGALGRHGELPVAYLIDAEGPHDSRVITFLEVGREQAVCGHWSALTDPSAENLAFWAEREAVRHIGGFAGRYLRLQAEVDHAQGPGVFRHAIEMIGAATATAHGGAGTAAWTRLNPAEYGNAVNALYTLDDPAHAARWVPGRLADHPDLEATAVQEMAALTAGTTPGRVRRRLTRPPSSSGLDASPFGLHPALVDRAGYPDNGYVDALRIGVGWHRPPLYMFWFKVQPDIARDTLDFSLYDAAYAAVPERLRILANVAPEGPVGEGHARPGSYLPVDEEGYLAFVRAAVERYDGDGVDDMPGLTNAITCWQVGNEPNVIAKSGFAELQAMTHGAIKQACPGCAVLIGGTTGMPPTDEYIRQFDRQYRPILDALAGTGFDVMDVHWYGDAGGDYRGIREVLAHVRAALEAAGFGAVPIWITEMGTYSGAPTSFRPPDLPPQTERQQAADLFKRFVYSLASGVEKVFPAFGLIEGFKHDDGYFDHTGFIYDGWGTGDLGLGVKKLAYFTYAKTTAMLEGSDWQTLETVRESGNVHAYRLTRDGVSLYVAWWDAFDDPSHAEGVQIAVTISGLQGSSVLATEVVPDAEAGCDVADPATAFRTETVPVAGGEATIHLGDSPVVVVSLPWVEPRS